MSEDPGAVTARRAAWKLFLCTLLGLLFASCPDVPVNGRCAANSECASGQVCSNQQCVAKTCPEVACPTGEACVSGKCFATACVSGPCRAGQVCVNSSCADETCVGKTCSPKELCVKGACYPAECGAAACGADEVCLDGVCVITVCVGVTCSAGGKCKAGKCEPTPCTAPADCPSGTGCVSGQCGPCATTEQCPAGQACTAGTCNSCNAEVKVDLKNCGKCARVCPVPVHASARCEKGVCGRGPCEAGFFDLDEAVFGCETACARGVCTGPTGAPIKTDNEPLPETGTVFHAAASGSSFGSAVQTNGSFTNIGILGEATPPGVGGAVELRSSKYSNVGGFTSALRKK